MNHKLERMFNSDAVAKFNNLSQSMAGQAEENHKISFRIAGIRAKT